MRRLEVVPGSAVRCCGTAVWKLSTDGLYRCSACGLPASWCSPGVLSQYLDFYCGHCGRKMANPCREIKQSRQDFISRKALLKEIGNGMHRLGFSDTDWILWVIRNMPSV